MPRSSRATSNDSKADARGISRHFEGWQPGLLAVFLAGTSAILAVPRSVEPTELPDPAFSPAAIARVAREDETLAARAQAESEQKRPLDLDVRALGSAIRAYGLADYEGNDAAVIITRRDVAQAALRARAQGEEPLAKLRAYQLRSFLRELRRWESHGEESDELRELGGAFVAMAMRNGWTDGRTLLMGDDVRRVLFKKRWNELTQARGARFDLGLDEQRVLLRFLLRHPPRDEAASASPPRGSRFRKHDERAAFASDQYRLRKIEELSKIDPAYPADLARGVVLYRMRRFASATEMFRRHLDAHPDGPNTLRVQNHLRAALGHASDEEL